MNTQVVIIGAGAAGIGAAHKLEQDGIKDYVILEARGRIGGRVHTLNSGEELGGAWLHEVPQNGLLKEAERLGIRTEFDDDKTKLVGLDGKSRDAAAAKVGPAFAKWLQDQPEMSLKEAAEKYGKTLSSDEERREVDEFAQINQLPNGMTWDLLSSDLVAKPPKQLRDKAVIGGYTNLLEKLAPADFKDHLHLNSEVVSITKTANGVDVVTKNPSVSTSPTQTYHAKQIVCTLPIGVLKYGAVKFSPPLDAGIQSAIDSTDVCAIGKVYLGFQNQFWSNDVYKWIVVGKNPALVWNWSAVHPEFATMPTLCLILCNDVIRAVEADKDNSFEIVKPYLEAVAEPGTSIAHAASTIVSTWVHDPYSIGGYSTYREGHSRAKAVSEFAKGDFDGRLLFAGEHCAQSGATFIHGAFDSGTRAASTITKSSL